MLCELYCNYSVFHELLQKLASTHKADHDGCLYPFIINNVHVCTAHEPYMNVLLLLMKVHELLMELYELGGNIFMILKYYMWYKITFHTIHDFLN